MKRMYDFGRAPRNAIGLIPTLGLPRVAVTGWLCGQGGRWGHDGFVFGGGQSAEGVLASASVVGAFDPGHDRDPELVAGGPSGGC